MWYKNFADQPEQALKEYKLFWFNEFLRHCERTIRL